MAQGSGVRRVTDALAVGTGRSVDDIRLALTLAVLTAVVVGALRLLKFFGDLGANVLGRS
jgi:hypothetical protein